MAGSWWSYKHAYSITVLQGYHTYSWWMDLCHMERRCQCKFWIASTTCVCCFLSDFICLYLGWSSCGMTLPLPQEAQDLRDISWTDYTILFCIYFLAFLQSDPLLQSASHILRLTKGYWSPSRPGKSFILYSFILVALVKVFPFLKACFSSQRPMVA
jgi:hypothetical protein